MMGTVLDSSLGAGCPWGCPHHPLSDGISPGPLIAPAVSPLRFSPGWRGIFPFPPPSRKSHISHKAATGVRGFGTARSIPMPPTPSPVTLRHVPCWSFGNGIHLLHSSTPGHTFPGGIRPGTPQNDAGFRERTGKTSWPRAWQLVGVSPGGQDPSGWDGGSRGGAGVLPWLPAHGHEIPFGGSLGNPGTGKPHLCNSLNSSSWLHSGFRVWDRSRYLEEALAGRLPWRGLRGSAWSQGTVTGAHWSRDAVTTVTISPGDVLRLQTSLPSQAPSSAHNAPVFQAQHG